MKKIFSNNRILALAFFTVFSAMMIPATGADHSPLPLEFKLIGMVNNDPMLELKYVSYNEEDQFTISVVDDQGFILYEENIIGKSFSKKFLLNRSEIGDQSLRFTIRSRKTGKTSWCEVNPARIKDHDLLVKSN